MKNLKVIGLGLLLTITGLVNECWGYSETFGNYTIDYGNLSYSIYSGDTINGWVSASAVEGAYPIEMDVSGYGEAISIFDGVFAQGSITIIAQRSFTLSNPYIPDGESADTLAGIKGSWGYDLAGGCSGDWSGFYATKHGWAGVKNGGALVTQWPEDEISIARGPFNPGETSANGIHLINTLTSNPVFLKVGVPYYLVTREYAFFNAWGVMGGSAWASIANDLDAKVVMSPIPEPATFLLLTLSLPFIPAFRRKKRKK